MVSMPASFKPWALPVDELVAALESNAADGLSALEARARRERDGPNLLAESKRRSFASVLLGQLKSPLVYLLFAVAVIAALLGERTDAAIIGVVVALNTIIGAVHEGRAERSLAALKKLAAHTARVVRDGAEASVDAADLAIGDVVVLAAGDSVPADARIVDAARAQADESALTGESVPAAKDAAPVGPDAPLGDRSSMLHSGTALVSGRARAVVVAIGQRTEVGRIAALASSAEPPPTPLARRIQRFGRTLLIAAAVLFAAIFGIGIWRGMDAGAIAMIGISQVVGLVPEGLPVAMTIALAIGVDRMAKRRALVRRLAAVETLGAITTICSDKTGTLTQNEMTVRRVVLASGEPIDMGGLGYAPEGAVAHDGAPVSGALASQLGMLLEACVLCNDAELLPPESAADPWRILGDPTEGALITAARKAGIDEASARRAAPRIAEIPFDSTSKLMATEHAGEAGPFVVVKGAPEAILRLCNRARAGDEVRPLSDADRARITDDIRKMASEALRVLAIAKIEGTLAGGIDDLRDAALLGLVGQIDPPRAAAKAAVVACRTAGIRPVMITGDHRTTAVAVAREVGIFRDGDRAVDGPDLVRMKPDEVARAASEAAVFSRVQPADKLRIVEALQERGAVVAMTGDGVNDAPALVRADVGVAMGRTGTDVAKEAAHIVVTDDDFATIVSAVEEGRVVQGNIRKVILLLVSTSVAEVVVLLLSLALGYPAPFHAVQILWNNLVTEGVVTVNLVLDPAEGDEMRRFPAPPDEPLVTRSMVGRIVLMASAIVISTLGWFIYRLETGVPFAQAQTEAFTTLAVCEWFNVLSVRSERHTALSRRSLVNRYLLGGLVVGNLLQVLVVFTPAMNRLFYTVPLDLRQVIGIGAIASLVLWAEELRKLVARRSRGSPEPNMV